MAAVRSERRPRRSAGTQSVFWKVSGKNRDEGYALPGALLSCPGKKVTKETGLRGASVQGAPLRIPRRFPGASVEKSIDFLLRACFIPVLFFIS